MRGLLTSAFGLSPTKWRSGKLEDGHRWFTNIISHILELKRHDEPGNLNIESAINCFIFVNPQKTLRVGGYDVGSVGNRKHTYLFGRPNSVKDKYKFLLQDIRSCKFRNLTGPNETLQDRNKFYMAELIY